MGGGREREGGREGGRERERERERERVSARDYFDGSRCYNL